MYNGLKITHVSHEQVQVLLLDYCLPALLAYMPRDPNDLLQLLQQLLERRGAGIQSVSDLRVTNMLMRASGFRVPGFGVRMWSRDASWCEQ